MIEVLIDGTPYTAFKEYNLERDFESISGSFTLSLSTLDGGLFPINRGAAIKVSIDGKQFADGYIDKISIDYSSTSHDILIGGRDKTQDIIDSTLDSNFELNTPISLENVIKKMLDYLGLNVKVINKAGNIDPYTSSELVSGSLGQGCFEVLDEYCRKRDVLLTTDGQGNIVITDGTGEAINGSIFHVTNGQFNNVKSAQVDYDDSKRFSSYTVKSQLNPSKRGGAGGITFSGVGSFGEQINTDVPTADIVSTKSTAFDENVRTSRKLVIKAEQSSTNADAKTRALYEREIRRARSLNYIVTMDGFKYSQESGAIWEPLQIVSVVDNFANIDEELLIRKVVYRLSLDSGQQTILELVPKIAYNLRPENKKFKAKKKKKGKGSSNITFDLS